MIKSIHCSLALSQSQGVCFGLYGPQSAFPYRVALPGSCYQVEGVFMVQQDLLAVICVRLCMSCDHSLCRNLVGLAFLSCLLWIIFPVGKLSYALTELFLTPASCPSMLFFKNQNIIMTF